MSFWTYSLIALSPGILYMVFLGVIGLWMKFHRGLCPGCGKQGLIWINFIKANFGPNSTQEGPAFWSYYRCEKCDVVWKEHGDRWSPAPQSEIECHNLR